MPRVMADRTYGAWAPATTEQLAGLFAGAPFPWWITGGVALELHAGRSWRAHGDADVGIRRMDAQAVRGWLGALHPFIASNGELRRWTGGPLSAGDAENNVWVKKEPDGPWWFDIAVGEGDERSWRYRREPSIGRDWSQAVLISAGGIPYLAPEIQLLFKSKGRREKDDLDAQVVIPLLDHDRRRWLEAHLDPGHRWVRLLQGPPTQSGGPAHNV